MNLIDYAKKYGLLTHKEKKFNDIDYLILANLSYVDFDGIIDSKDKKITLKEAGEKYFDKFTNKKYRKNVLGVQAAITIFKAVYKYPRYRDLLVYNYRYIKSECEQFSAMCIDISNHLTYISFEGTDDLIVGWKEDAELAYKYPTSSQKDATNYLNEVINIFSSRTYIVGGHSKGGNLALVGTMNALSIVKAKIKHIYNFDGPGIRLEQYKSRQYKMLKYKYTLVVPNYSIIGILLNHPKDMVVVNSNHVGLLAHNCISWEVEKDKFMLTELSEFSKKFDEVVYTWGSKYNEAERRIFVEDLFDIFERAEIKSVVDIKANIIPKMAKIIKETKSLSPESKEMINELYRYMKSNIKIIAGGAIKYSITPKKH